MIDTISNVVRGEKFITDEDRANAKTGCHEAYKILSLQELIVIQLTAEGYSENQIGRIMDRSPRTVQTQKNRAKEKLKLTTVPCIVRYAWSNALIFGQGI